MTIPTDLDPASLGTSVSRFKPFVTLETLRGLCQGTSVLTELLDQVLSNALRYAESVCRFNQIVIKHKGAFDAQGERAEIEKVRGSIHDSFIDDVNILIRVMRKQGKDVRWSDALDNQRVRYGCLSLTLSFEILAEQKAA